ncbi:hypothetical protein LLS1_18570 [Leifsonia sp. LS1]|uniref:hypothetical protein n=1 Tax=Leifsonia sp. LS1 TaxID=2828483 RepID=UPI001CFD2F42|nr:hypothetical protein [Leifsonia sp. LS1]GIT80188.1 hypothetical protein LLS1_18570 [Leifsonia sp. LS1]
MFRTNAFGQRINCLPRLRFIDGEPDKGGGDDGNKGGGDLGFPADTPLTEMTVEQREAYWKQQARKHESTAKSRQDYDQLKADSEELAKLKKDGQTDQEKALEEAREEARREGENLGAERYLKDAVTARFGALTGKSQEDVDKAFAHIDVHSFVGQDGAIDNDALTEFASTFGTNDNGGGSSQQIDPVKAALERQRGGGTGGGDGSGSIQAIREAAREKLAPAKK